jgi:thiosulfate dehydrogenase
VREYPRVELVIEEAPTERVLRALNGGSLDGAHPETYAKFQPQIGRVVFLRDMINWCIEHPVRGKPLASDDPRMRALEAYILAQRKGKALDYGRH